MKNKWGLKKNLGILLIYLLLTALIFVFDQSAFLNKSKLVLLSVTKPFFDLSEKSVYQLTKPFEWLIRQQGLQEEINKLNKKNLDIIAQKVHLSELEEENTFLKKALNVKEQTKSTVLLGKIIGKSSEIEQNIIIDIGSNDGVMNGSTVVYPENYLVGKVVEVFSRFSRIELITSPNISIASRGVKSKTDALCQGDINHLKIEVVDYQKNPEEGEFFITSGIDGYPAGLILGQLKSITNNPVAVSRTGELNLIINPTILKKVLVFINND